MFNLGIDVGGTFTDAVAIDDAGNVFIGKAHTTPERITAGVMASLDDLADRTGVTLSSLLGQTRFLGHGTTVGTNALVTRAGAQVGLLITAGFDDTPYIQRAIGRLAGLSEQEVRQQVSLRQPRPLVERRLIRGVTERVDSTGRVVIPLLRHEAESAVRELLDRGAEAIAICLLWSFANPVHEEMLAGVVRELAPGVPVSLSSELAPKIRENARCNTVLIDAFVRGRVRDYLDDLRLQLHGQGFERAIATMQCFGGVTDAAQVSAISTIDSGPVGGVMAGRYLAELLAEENVITTDVGGTSFDVSVICRGRELMAREFFGSAGVMSRFEVLVPRVDIKTIGAGGGTIARFDPASRTIKFGPESAGANPGPVFYGRGGGRPTLADAWLVLGYLDPDHFLGGRVKVNTEAATAAIREQLAAPLGVDVAEAAYAVVELASHHMSDAIRVFMTARGLDTGEFALLAFGGGGPMHSAAYGRLAGVRRTYLLAHATVFSAFGIALADTKHKQERSLVMREPFDSALLARTFGDLEARLVAQFQSEGLPTDAVDMRHTLDLRYRGQVHELAIEVPGKEWVMESGTRGIKARFAEQYQAVYGSAAIASLAQVELVAVGVEGVSRIPKPKLRRGDCALAPVEPAAFRPAYFGNGYVRTAVYRHDDLGYGHVVEGPGIVQADYVTMLVLPGQSAQVDPFGNLVIDHRAEGRRS